jgi:branched-chain amino acid transport system substrate-binding protein
MGDEAVGVITALHYSGALDTPENKKFAAAYRARFRRVPSYYSESMYTGGKYLLAAIESLKGTVENREVLLDAIRKARPMGLPRGPVTLDEYGNPVQNIYVRRVDRVGPELQNTVIATLPAVSQFWKYAPAEYLRQPLYAR